MKCYKSIFVFSDLSNCWLYHSVTLIFSRYSHRDRELSSLQKKLSEVEGKLADLETKLSQANRDVEKHKGEAQVGCDEVSYCFVWC